MPGGVTDRLRVWRLSVGSSAGILIEALHMSYDLRPRPKRSPYKHTRKVSPPTAITELALGIKCIPFKVTFVSVYPDAGREEATGALRQHVYMTGGPR